MDVHVYGRCANEYHGKLKKKGKKKRTKEKNEMYNMKEMAQTNERIELEMLCYDGKDSHK